jgi:hypothetical protein
MTIGQEVIGHFDQLFAEIEQAINACPDELWTRQADDDGWNWNTGLTTPRFLVHHMVWCMALAHLLRMTEKDMPHSRPPDYGPDKTITPRQVLDILGEIRTYAHKTYAHMPDAEYLTPDENGQTPLGRMRYALAHTRHHYGQFVQMLRDADSQPPARYPL